MHSMEGNGTAPARGAHSTEALTMTGIFILVGFALAIVAALVVALRRRNRTERRSGVHPEDEPDSPKVG